MKESISSNNRHPKDLVWFHGNIGYFFSSNELMYVQAQGNYTKLFFKNHEPILSNHTMKDLMNMLSSVHFFRTHHSYIVNLHYISKLVINEEATIELENTDVIPLSSRKKSAFIASFFKI